MVYFAVSFEYFGNQTLTTINPESSGGLILASKSNFMKINENDIVTTYIDRIIQLKYPYDGSNISNFFLNFLNIARKEIEAEIMAKQNKKYNEIIEEEHKLVNTVLYNKILILLINKIMNENLTFDELLKVLIKKAKECIIPNLTLYQIEVPSCSISKKSLHIS